MTAHILHFKYKTFKSLDLGCNHMKILVVYQSTKLEHLNNNNIRDIYQ